MRIGVLSDTHIPEAGPDLPPAAYAALRGCDFILHCGDIHGVETLDRLERVAPVYAARGNGDDYHPVPRRPGIPHDDPRIAETRILELEGFRIGMTHDLEVVEGRSEEFALDLTRSVFGQEVDIALFGHSHVPSVWGLSSGLAILNPGSPTMPYGYMNIVGTVAHLELRRGGFEFRVLNLRTDRIELSLKGPGTVPYQKGPKPDWR